MVRKYKRTQSPPVNPAIFPKNFPAKKPGNLCKGPCTRHPLFVIEAALLIEDHYERICDELWYVRTGEEIRRKRLMASRGYTAEKAGEIISPPALSISFPNVSTIL